MKHCLQKFDIFSIPFTFNIGSKVNKKRTTIGGLLSILILISSLSYLGYLLS
jgi:hypothetical protein